MTYGPLGRDEGYRQIAGGDPRHPKEFTGLHERFDRLETALRATGVPLPPNEELLDRLDRLDLALALQQKALAGLQEQGKSPELLDRLDQFGQWLAEQSKGIAQLRDRFDRPERAADLHKRFDQLDQALVAHQRGLAGLRMHPEMSSELHDWFDRLGQTLDEQKKEIAALREPTALDPRPVSDYAKEFMAIFLGVCFAAGIVVGLAMYLGVIHFW